MPGATVTPPPLLEKASVPFFKQHRKPELGGRGWDAEATRLPSDSVATRHVRRPALHTCHAQSFLPRAAGLTWWPTVFLCSLLEAFSWGLEERMLIFEDEPFADVLEAGAESLSS